MWLAVNYRTGSQLTGHLRPMLETFTERKIEYKNKKNQLRILFLSKTRHLGMALVFVRAGFSGYQKNTRYFPK